MVVAVANICRSLKTALRTRGKYWLHQLPVVLLSLQIRPDEDSSCPFSRITGEQPLVPHIIPSNFSLTELSIALHKLPFSYEPPRQTRRRVHMPEQLKNCKAVWLRTDRVKRPLEAPYQGPFDVIRRSDDTFTKAIRLSRQTKASNTASASSRSDSPIRQRLG